MVLIAQAVLLLSARTDTETEKNLTDTRTQAHNRSPYPHIGYTVGVGNKPIQKYHCLHLAVRRQNCTKYLAIKQLPKIEVERIYSQALTSQP